MCVYIYIKRITTTTTTSATTQLKLAAGEQAKITVLRLNKLLLALGEEKQEGGSRL